FFELKNIHVVLRQGCGIHCADRKVLDPARSFLFRLCKYSHQLLFTRLGNIENVSFRVMAAVINEGSTGRAFNSANGGIFFLDSFEHFANVIDRYAEMIKTARIPWTALVESNANVAIA